MTNFDLTFYFVQIVSLGPPETYDDSVLLMSPTCPCVCTCVQHCVCACVQHCVCACVQHCVRVSVRVFSIVSVCPVRVFSIVSVCV